MIQSPEPTPSPKPKDWANATPAGLVALAIACFCFFALLTGHISTSAQSNALPLMACWLLGGFATQLIVALIDLKGGNAAGGNTFLYFSAFFMLVGGIEFLLKSFVPGLDARVDGWAWLVLTLSMWLWMPAFFKSNALLTIVVLALGVALPFITMLDLQLFSDAGVNKAFESIAAWAMLVSGCTAIYLSAATIVNGAYGKVVFPNPGPFYKQKDAPKSVSSKSAKA